MTMPTSSSSPTMMAVVTQMSEVHSGTVLPHVLRRTPAVAVVSLPTSRHAVANIDILFLFAIGSPKSIVTKTPFARS